MTSVELPFRAEYAKSARSSCKSCKDKIEKEHLRLAVMVQSPMFDGKVPHWYHFHCFFLKQRPKNVGDISHFESLRWEDQEKIKNALENCKGAPPASGKSSSSKAVKRKHTKQDPLADFKVEYAKSNRALCRACEEHIIMGDVRVSKKDFESDEGKRYGGIDLWHHLDCFAKVRHEFEFWSSGSKLPGIKTIKEEDQIKVKQLLPEMKPIKKEVKDEPDGDVIKKPKLENNVILKEQNQKIYRYRDQLKTMSKKDLIKLLEKNKQETPVGIDSILDRLADAMSFGALEKCPNCKNGQLVFRSGMGYFCLGHVDEWAKCESVFDDPARKPFVVPSKLKEAYEFLGDYKFKKDKRVFEKNAPSASTIANSTLTLAKSIKSESQKSGPKIQRNLPFRRMQFCVIGKLSKSKKDIKYEVEKLGGSFSSKIHEKITAVISSEAAVKKKGSEMKMAEDWNIQAVPESFLEECQKGADPIATINRMNLTTWGSDPSDRLCTETKVVKSTGHSSKSWYKSDAPTKVTVKIHDGVAVDPQSELESVAHVYRDPNGNIYNASLALTDLQTGKNSYYKMQVLESNTGVKKSYWLFKSWGRIGTTIGGTKIHDDLSREHAIDEFKTAFLERTANCWENRKNFRKVPGKMVMIDVSYDDDEMDGNIKDTVPSRLEKEVQDLVKLVLNIDLMKNVMKEMELDLEKMPLGKLSKKQIQEAFHVLTELQNCLNQKGDAVEQKTVIRYTNQFFSLIPHDFGIDNPPLLNNLDVIKQKNEMLDSLMEIEIAYSLMKKPEDGNENVNLVDLHYQKLKANIGILKKTDPVFEVLQLYLKNTHAETHRNYNLEIMEIFKVDRHGEDERFDSFKKLHNKKLLWHGSRLTNFAGIISQGLRIAPPEAPVTGYMFGKGIYFADMVSKSANYCMANPSNNTGLLLLCEVALGNMHELFEAQNIVKLPKGKHSVKGMGKTQPDPKITKMLEDGVEVPLGPGISSPHMETSLLYNEYIVYNVAQVRVKYLVQVKFDFNY